MIAQRSSGVKPVPYSWPPLPFPFMGSTTKVPLLNGDRSITKPTYLGSNKRLPTLKLVVRSVAGRNSSQRFGIEPL
jgi:hypothetical protein